VGIRVEEIDATSEWALWGYVILQDVPPSPLSSPAMRGMAECDRAGQGDSMKEMSHQTMTPNLTPNSDGLQYHFIVEETDGLLSVDVMVKVCHEIYH